MMNCQQLTPECLMYKPAQIRQRLVFVGVVMLLYISYLVGRTQEIQHNTYARLQESAYVMPDESTSNTTRPKRVVLLAYYRGGSSFLGELMNQNPDVFYVFEPLRGVNKWIYGNWGVNTTTMYMENSPFRDVWIGDVQPFEAEGTVNAMKAIMTCGVEQLPLDYYLDTFRIDRPHLSMQAFRKCYRSQKYIVFPRGCNSEFEKSCMNYNDACYKRAVNLTSCFKEWMCPHTQTKDAFYDHTRCLFDKMSRLAPCLVGYSMSCRKSSIIATKVIRMRMRYARYLLKELPDVKLVHLVRDPRGVFFSQKKISPRLLSNISSIRALCDSMLDDVVERRSLEELYPDSFLQVRYEDMSEDPHGTAANIYSHIGVPQPPLIKKWIAFNTGVGNVEISNNNSSNITERDVSGSKAKRSSTYGTYRGNSTATAYSWLSKLSDSDHCVIDSIQQCKMLIKLLNYQLSDNSEKC